ncbi:MAG: MBL fold metallo-hydrolase [Chloroflexota bacterium]
MAGLTLVHSHELEERPTGYVGPNLDPTGLVLQPHDLAPDVVALLANQIPKNNNGLIVGERAALVVDAGINGTVARQIQELVRRQTDCPLHYLVNTTYHGDHTFGNAAFPPSVLIASSAQNKASMSDLAREKRIREQNLRGNVAAITDVDTWRTPDIVFESYLAIDLGGQQVELWHFGAGNAPGDTVVYVPSARAAWTGNFLSHAGLVPMLLEGGPSPYRESVERFLRTLDVQTIIPGHGPIGDGRDAARWLIGYLQDLSEKVQPLRHRGLSAEEAIEALPLDERFAPPSEAPGAAGLQEYAQHAHRLNVLVTYRSLESTNVSSGADTRG